MVWGARGRGMLQAWRRPSAANGAVCVANDWIRMHRLIKQLECTQARWKAEAGGGAAAGWEQQRALTLPARHRQLQGRRAAHTRGTVKRHGVLAALGCTHALYVCRHVPQRPSTSWPADAFTASALSPPRLICIIMLICTLLTPSLVKLCSRQPGTAGPGERAGRVLRECLRMLRQVGKDEGQ